MNRANKHSLKTRQLIFGYRGLPKMNKTIGTPPCILRQPWVSVRWPTWNLLDCKKINICYFVCQRKSIATASKNYELKKVRRKPQHFLSFVCVRDAKSCKAVFSNVELWIKLWKHRLWYLFMLYFLL